jgi:hypothetical protein
MMNLRLRVSSLIVFCLFARLGLGAVEPAPVYELRVYSTHPGKMPDLLKRFREHTCAIFSRHGMVGIAYWLPLEAAGGEKLYYILRHASRDAAKASWAAFNADPEWQAVRQASEAAGPIVIGVESTFLAAADFSPAFPSLPGGQVFELRTYTANDGKLGALDARFRDHTITLFARHGITSVQYWHPTDPEKGAGHTLIYLLAHANRAAAQKSWDDFHADPDWVQAKTASEKDGPLLAHPPMAVFLTPTDFSPMQ